jgi:hypothetical protein
LIHAWNMSYSLASSSRGSRKKTTSVVGVESRLDWSILHNLKMNALLRTEGDGLTRVVVADTSENVSVYTC